MGMGCLLVFSGIALSSCAGHESVTAESVGREYAPEDYDVVLSAVPFKVTKINQNSVVDAVEDGAQRPGVAEAVVLFEIERVIRGEFTKVRAGGPTKIEQARQAVQKKDLLQVLTLDFSDPDEEYEKPWVSVAVSDPDDSFGIEDWDNPEGKLCRLYLKRLPDRDASYVMVRSEKQG